jgi:hypothetical protein
LSCPFPPSGRGFDRKLPNCRRICWCLFPPEFGKTVNSGKSRTGFFVPRSNAFFSYPALRSWAVSLLAFGEIANVSVGRWFCWGEQDFRAIFENLKAIACPHCKSIGRLVRHGFLRGYDESSPREKVVRAWRIFCSNRNNRKGCGRTFSVWIADKIRRLSLSAGALWTFLQSVVADGIGAAIRRVDCHLSDRQMQRIWKRFDLGQSQIRTALWQQGEPPELPAKSPQSPAAEVLAHLQAAFPTAGCPIAAFQHALRRFFL